MKIKQVLSLFAACLIITSCGKSGPDLNMIPVQQGSKSLYIDTKGKIVLETEHRRANYFTDGLARFVSDSGKIGFIDTKGKIAIEPQFKEASSFSEGISWATKEDGHPEAINTKGKVLFTMEQAQRVHSFREGLAVFETIGEDGKTLYGCVNKSGKIVVEPQENEIESDFVQGKAVISGADNFKKGYIDKSGKIIINCQFDEAGDFGENGLACVQFGDKWGVINSKGEYVINPKYDRIAPDGDWFIIVEDHKAGWCDKDGKYKINPQFRELLPFGKNDLAPVCEGKMWGYVDRKGVLKSSPQFEMAFPFINNEVAVVSVNDKVGLINKEEKYIVNPQYDGIDDSYLEYVALGKTSRSTVYSDYFNMSDIVGKIENLVNNEGVDGNPYTSHITYLMDKYNLKQSNFPKNNTAVQLKKEKLSNDADYVLYVVGNPWIRSNQGWFSNYAFDPNYVPGSYNIVVDLNWRKKDKAEKLTREMCRILGIAGIPQEKIEEKRPIADYDNVKQMTVSYNDGKVTANVTKVYSEVEEEQDEMTED